MRKSSVGVSRWVVPIGFTGLVGGTFLYLLEHYLIQGSLVERGLAEHQGFSVVDYLVSCACAIMASYLTLGVLYSIDTARFSKFDLLVGVPVVLGAWGMTVAVPLTGWPAALFGLVYMFALCTLVALRFVLVPWLGRLPGRLWKRFGPGARALRQKDHPTTR